MTSVVQISGLRKQYNGREVVRGIDLNVSAGRCFGLLGPNGAGKTTTLREIAGLRRVSEVQIQIQTGPPACQRRQ